MKARMSILGLYNYDTTIFDNFIVPTALNKDDLISNLLLELSELEILYPDPKTMKMAIGIWSNKEIGIWNKLYETTQFEYNPIWNTDRTEEATDTETQNLANNNTETRDLVNTDSSTNINTNISTNSGTDSTTNYVAGFNDATEAQSEKIDVELGTSNTTTDNGNIENNGTDTGTVVNNGSNTGTISNQHDLRTFGNIGVSTTQQLIREEREVVKFNIYDYIINSFKNRFCLLVY